MKFQLQNPAGQNLFTGYGDGYLLINGVRYEGTMVVTPQRIVTDWQAASFATLRAAHFEVLRALKPDIVLLGTGPVLRFPQPALYRCLMEARIGVEVMDNSAVCRTYNILTGEGRNVVAAILPC
jgi:uncharacterized protein